MAETTPYIYAPLPLGDAAEAYYGGKVLKCQGIATERSIEIVRAQHPDAVVLDRYRGDRIDAVTHLPVLR